MEEESVKNAKKITFFSNKKRLINISIFGLILSILLACIILFIIYGVVPCALRRCHPNSNCINHPFWGECICKNGYGGDGWRYCDECGVHFRENNAKIVGGVEAVAHSWPSIVFITAEYKTILKINDAEFFFSQTFFCGGSLINRRTVVTAAHCIFTKITKEFNGTVYTFNVTENNYYPTIGSIYKVYLGADYYILDDFDIKPTTVYNVEQVIVHEDYDDVNYKNDIAILKLSSIVDLNENVQISCLPNPKYQSFPMQNSSGIAAGWGRIAENNVTSTRLRNVKLTILNGSYCDVYSMFYNASWDSQICAGEVKGGKDTCQGDSGGPLYVSDYINGKQKYVLSGITSYGIGCASEHFPGIYTNTRYFLDWIGKNSKF